MRIYRQAGVEALAPPKLEGVSPLIARLLCLRGVCDEQSAEAFLYPTTAQLHDPFLLQDMDKAVHRLKLAMEKREKVCVYGDYDADGVCAVSMLVDCLKQMGADVFAHIPSRQEEGYGLNAQAVKRLAEQGVNLIVTVDNGISAFGEIALCGELGVDVVVSDHHLCIGGQIPECCAVVCHTRPDDTYPNGDICGAATVFKLISALVGQEAAMRYLPLAGIATMADVVPLLGENRVLVALALKQLNADGGSIGLRALAQAANLREGQLTARDLAFGLVPRLNAAGRMQDASMGVELLLCEDQAQAAKLAEQLDKLNAKRQQEEMEICEEACARIEQMDITDTRVIVLKGEWNPGVIGIAASRICERYHRPTMLFAIKDDLLVGSSRSIPGVHLHDALSLCASLMLRFGGHAYAAGATIAAQSFEAFCEAFEAAVREVTPDESVFFPSKTYEIQADLSQMNLRLAQELRLLAPFGEGNPQPLFRLEDVSLRQLRRMGDGSHLKAVATSGDSYAQTVLFGMGERMEELLNTQRCDMLVFPEANAWRGNVGLQLQVRDVRACPIQDAKGFVAAHEQKFYDAFSYNLLYNSECTETLPKLIEDADEWIERHVRSTFAGALVLLFTPQGAETFISRLTKEDFERMDVGCAVNLPGPCAYHAAVLAPRLDKLRISRYRHILIYDSAISVGLVQQLQALAPNAEICAARASGEQSLLTNFRFTREDLIPAYKALSAANRRFYNREEFAEYLALRTDTPRYMSYLAAGILLELGFASEENGIGFVPGAPSRDLSESQTFALLSRVEDYAQRYARSIGGRN